MTTTAPSTSASAAEESPTQALASRISSLRTRAGAGNRDRLMLYVGGALLPLGLLVVILGWYGASHTVLLFEQIPYLISGGQIGTALVFAGGFIYFAYWMSLLVRESRTRHDEMVTVLRDIHAELASGSPAAAAVSAVPAGLPSTAEPLSLAGSASASLVATATGSMVHRPECQVVAGKAKLRPVTDPSEFVPCKLCRPLD